MKIVLMIVFSLFSPLLLLSQKTKIVPPRTLKVNDSLYVDETELTNTEWRGWTDVYFLQIKKDTPSYYKFLPDTMAWGGDGNFAYQAYYFRHPSYNLYPVVGISYEQAIEYCKWRTYSANLYLYLKEKKIKQPRFDSIYQVPIHFIYRLPTIDEWELIAKSGIDSSASRYKRWKNRSTHLFHTKENFSRVDSINDAFTPGPVKIYFQNKYGVYNMIGNVAELTSTKGVAKGGSFAHSLEESTYSNQQFYSKPEKWLGFRCVAVIVSK